MALNLTPCRSQYIGNGTTTAFATDFYFLSASVVEVFLTDTSGNVITLNPSTDYTVSGAGNPSGGTVTCTVAPTSGYTVTILRSTPLVQDTTFVPNDALPAPSLENGLDLLTMMQQELTSPGGSVDRSIKFPVTEPAGFNPILPTIQERAGSTLGFDNNGNFYTYDDVGQPRGNWTTATAYNFRDLVTDPATQNLYTVTTAYTSGSTLAGDVTAGDLKLLINAQAINPTGVTTKNVYLAPRTDGVAGTGTYTNPFDVSTAAKLDTLIAAQTTSVATTFYFAPGSYYTALGLPLYSNWSYLGSGQGKTVINLSSLSSTASNSGVGGLATFYGTSAGMNNIVVRDLTIDGGAALSAVALTASFTLPAANASVTVPVASSASFVVGSYYYVQNAADANGKKLWYGGMKCTAIPNGTSVTLQNNMATLGGTLPDSAPGAGSSNDPQPGVTVPATASVFLLSGSGLVVQNRIGLFCNSSNTLVENVTVQNVTAPVYEGPVGIVLGFGSNAIAGNLINNCTIQNIYGRFGWCISFANVLNSTASIYASCNITNCTVSGHGYYQGIGMGAQSTNSVISGNSVSNVEFGLFHDTGNTNKTFCYGNSVSASQICLNLSSGIAHRDSHYFGNTLTVTATGGSCIRLYGNVINEDFNNNTLRDGVGSGCQGVFIGNTGNTGNSFNQNHIDHTLTNTCVAANGTEIGNTNELNASLILGLTGLVQSPLTLTTTGTSGASTLSGGTLNIPNYAAGSGIVRVKAQIFTSTGTYTPSSGLLYAIVEVQGAGAGGGGSAATSSGQTSAGAGGTAGAYAKSILSAATIGASQTVTIGAPGTGTTSSGGGSAASSFGALLNSGTAPGGGVGGVAVGLNTYASANSTATTAGNVINISGEAGQNSLAFSSGNPLPGAGGRAALGAGGYTNANIAGSSTFAGVTPSGYGGGGSGASSGASASAQAGGAGAPGIVIVTEFCNV